MNSTNTKIMRSTHGGNGHKTFPHLYKNIVLEDPLCIFENMEK